MNFTNYRGAGVRAEHAITEGRKANGAQRSEIVDVYLRSLCRSSPSLPGAQKSPSPSACRTKTQNASVDRERIGECFEASACIVRVSMAGFHLCAMSLSTRACRVC